ncbi:MAG: hypothetical protein RLZZ450_6825 [Pseudomonadota bacterium]|jgi:SpoVK/Ycf46/Vps4 family AAA+-type ATPase
MATRDQLVKLLTAVGQRNWTAAHEVAQRLADDEEQRGHFAAATQLRGALQSRTGAALSTGTPSAQLLGDPGFLGAALTELSGDAELSDVVLTGTQQLMVRSLLAEWSQRATLSAHSVERRSRLLFHGPPGCGKSLTARAIAAELALRAYVVRMDAVVGAYLGQTALRVRELFRFAEQHPCVLVLDEIDALGRVRGSDTDVGELDRVVITLMQELEHSHPAGIVIATSNLAHQLDPALFRRFDAVLEFPLPTKAALARYMAKRARSKGILGAAEVPKPAPSVKTYHDAERCIVDLERSKLLARSS